MYRRVVSRSLTCPFSARCFFCDVERSGGCDAVASPSHQHDSLYEGAEFNVAGRKMASPLKLKADIERGRKIALREATKWGSKKGSGCSETQTEYVQAPTRDPIRFVSSDVCTSHGQQIASWPQPPNAAEVPAMAQAPQTMASRSSAAAAPTGEVDPSIGFPPLSVHDSVVDPSQEQPLCVDAPSHDEQAAAHEAAGSALILERTEGCLASDDVAAATRSPLMSHLRLNSTLPADLVAPSAPLLVEGVGLLLDGDSASKPNVDGARERTSGDGTGCALHAVWPSQIDHGQHLTPSGGDLRETAGAGLEPKTSVGAEADGCDVVDGHPATQTGGLPVDGGACLASKAKARSGGEFAGSCDGGVMNGTSDGETNEGPGSGQIGAREEEALADEAKATTALRRANEAEQIHARPTEGGDAEANPNPTGVLDGSAKGGTPSEKSRAREIRADSPNCSETREVVSGAAASGDGEQGRLWRQTRPYQVQPALAAVDRDAWREAMARGMASFRNSTAKRSRRGSPISPAPPSASPLSPAPPPLSSISPVPPPGPQIACTPLPSIDAREHAMIQEHDPAGRGDGSGSGLVERSVPGGPAGLGQTPDVVVLIDGDNCANILKFVQQFVRDYRARACAAHVFVSRHYDGPCPKALEMHRAITGLPDAADHELTFFAGMRSDEWSSHGTRVLIVSKDDALENTVALLRQRCENIRAHFITPTSINGVKDLNQKLAALA